MKKQWILLSAAAMIVLTLSACGTNNSNTSHDNMEMGEMNHSSSGELPAGLKEAVNPTFKVGSEVTIHSDHMEGMNGAEGKVVGAYSTTVYAVSYTPTTGGEEVKDHQWVVHEELKDSGVEAYKVGDEVVLEASHMEGMNGATATIDSAEQTTIYMVDYMPTTGGDEVKNHQWVTESEISSK
ncbi:YdhK family protein [Paenibacillus sp. Marseille-Q4541]|uniref:YdhK family protein n=1 Tax=Paenibacillus sp. Marseille-Q4541 TaxID=2831522 RepID=UPI001BAA272A|nr:YdhK family protein [Paenibacillus sp. Marseille-Q4541]